MPLGGVANGCWFARAHTHTIHHQQPNDLFNVPCPIQYCTRTCMYSCCPVQTISLTEGRATSGINGVIQCEGISVVLDGQGVAVPARTAAHFSAAPYLYMRRGSGAPLLCSQVPSRYLIARGYLVLLVGSLPAQRHAKCAPSSIPYAMLPHRSNPHRLSWCVFSR